MPVGICPNCHSENLDYGTSVLQDMQMGYPVECKNCGFKGKEWYDLKFTGYTDENGNEVEKCEHPL